MRNLSVKSSAWRSDIGCVPTAPAACLITRSAFRQYTAHVSAAGLDFELISSRHVPVQSDARYARSRSRLSEGTAIREEVVKQSREGDARAESRNVRSGRSGKKVTSRKQAIAIGLSEARRAGAKVPKKKTTAKKRSAAKKTTARKKTSAGRKTTKRSSAKKS
jgi:hypothetical protein